MLQERGNFTRQAEMAMNGEAEKSGMFPWTQIKNIISVDLFLRTENAFISPELKKTGKTNTCQEYT